MASSCSLGYDTPFAMLLMTHGCACVRRFDEVRACLHLDVLGKEYVLRCESKDDTLEWFVAIAQGCGLA